MSKHKRLAQEPLPDGEIPKVGELYHVSWAFKNGFVWKVKSVDEKYKKVQLVTPKTNRPLPYQTSWKDLRLTREAERKLRQKQELELQ